MIDNQYYPTPENVIKLMLAPYKTDSYRSPYSNLEDKTILDPEGGEGAILDFISENIRYKKEDFYTCEINPDFQYTLSGKGYHVIGDDFLQLEIDIFFDFIIMNPPFKNGDKHLLKAWEILNEGDIVCLLNAETINNPHTSTRRKLAHLIDQHGSTEHIGQVFIDAERTTKVSTVIVRLHKDKPETDMFDLDLDEDKERNINFNEEDYSNKVATRSIVRNLMIQIEESNKAFIEFVKAYEKVKFYSSPLDDRYFNPAEFLMNILKDNVNNQKRYNKFTNYTRGQAWKQVLNSDLLAKFMTSEMSKNFDSFLKSKSNLAFNETNVRSILEMIVANRGTIMQQAVINVFDMMTKYHAKNKVEEGWKTNDSWKVNRKVIIPWLINYGEYCNQEHLKQYGDRFKVSYNYQMELLDIDKVLCYLSGKDFNGISTIYEVLNLHFDRLGNIKTGEKFTNEINSTFFKIKFWKKGTLHLYFKDKELWERFNIEAAKGKMWLPEEQPEKKRKPRTEPDPVPEKEQLTLF